MRTAGVDVERPKCMRTDPSLRRASPRDSSGGRPWYFAAGETEYFLISRAR